MHWDLSVFEARLRAVGERAYHDKLLAFGAPPMRIAREAIAR